MNCTHCGNLMVNGFTTFTVIREDIVYVIEAVPCLECPQCEHIAFTQDVAKKLERYSSGRVIPRRIKKALVFRWGDPINEIPKATFKVATINSPLAVTIGGTVRISQ